MKARDNKGRFVSYRIDATSPKLVVPEETEAVINCDSVGKIKIFVDGTEYEIDKSRLKRFIAGWLSK